MDIDVLYIGNSTNNIPMYYYLNTKYSHVFGIGMLHIFCHDALHLSYVYKWKEHITIMQSLITCVIQYANMAMVA